MNHREYIDKERTLETGVGEIYLNIFNYWSMLTVWAGSNEASHMIMIRKFSDEMASNKACDTRQNYWAHGFAYVMPPQSILPTSQELEEIDNLEEEAGESQDQDIDSGSDDIEEDIDIETSDMDEENILKIQFEDSSGNLKEIVIKYK